MKASLANYYLLKKARKINIEQEPKFKDYKEKQAYYKKRAKEYKMFWFSCEPKDPRKKKVGLIKGRTYVKKENE